MAGKTESTASKNKQQKTTTSGPAERERERKRERKYMSVNKSDIMNTGLKEKARNNEKREIMTD